MPTRRALLPKACIICGQQWTPHTSKQAREKQTCSPICAGRASGRHRIGLKRPQKSDPAGRICTRCGQFKGWGQFAWKTAGVERTCWCRTCARTYNRDYRARYQASINAEHKRARALGRWQRGPRSRMARKWRKSFEHHDRAVEKTRRCAQLVGTYFRDYQMWCAACERSGLYLNARLILAWLLRSHAWMSEEQIAAALRTSTPTVRWSIATVRAAVRDQHGRGVGSLGTGRDDMQRLKLHAQELLRRAEGHAPGSLEPLAQPHEDERAPAPTALDVYWRKRAAQQERERSYG